MKPEMEARARALAEYVIETGGTVRSAARRFGIQQVHGT
jgi:transposase-like protein